MKVHEILSESVYKEIEFVCANSEFPDATDPVLQKKMYTWLKTIPGVIPLYQDQTDYSEGQYSLTAIYKDNKTRSKILALAKRLGVEVDLDQPVSDDYVDRALRGEHEGQIQEAFMNTLNLNSDPETVVHEEEINEIERMRPGGYTGGKGSLQDTQFGKQVKKLPGGSGFLYSTNEGRWGGIDIKLWDPKGKDYLAKKVQVQAPRPVQQYGEVYRAYALRLRDWERSQRGVNLPGQLIGKLTLDHIRSFPLEGAVQVDTITVDEDYRSMGLAKALYGIVLTIMKRPLLAGSMQTPGGRRNWVSLASIPGVEMKGYFALHEYELDPNKKPDFGWQRTRHANANKNIDIIMGKLGGQHIGVGRSGLNFFAFDVQPNTTGDELEAYVNTRLSKLYGTGAADTGLYAVWTGQ